MKHKFLIMAAALTAVCGLATFTACKEGGAYGTKGLKYHEVYDGDTVIGYTFSGMGNVKKKDIVIASEYEGLPVVGIGYTEEQAEAARTELAEKYEKGQITGTEFLHESFSFVTPFLNISLLDVLLPDDQELLERLSTITSVVIPETVTYIAEDAFYGCGSLTSIKVAEGNPIYHSAGNCIVETASKTLLAGCSTSVIPNGVTTIGDSAFFQCTKLTSVELPNSVTAIGDSAFGNYDNLTDVYYTGTEEEWKAISIGNFNENLTDATIHYNYKPENS